MKVPIARVGLVPYLIRESIGVHVMQSVRRTLVIGLGKSGKLVAQRLRQLLEQRYHCLPFVSFYVIDHAEQQAKESPFLPAEELVLSELGVQEFVNQNASIKSRIPARLQSDGRIALEFNTGSDGDLINTRLGANLLFMRKAKQVQRALEIAVRRLFDEKEWPEAKRKGFEPEKSTEVTIYLIASLAEPYGGGLLVDMAYLVQYLSAFVDKSYSCSTTGILLLFSDAENDSISKANVYATLKELDYYMTHKGYRNRHLGIKESDKRPFSRACHLIDLTNEAGLSFKKQASLETGETFRDPEAGRAMVVEWLHQMIFHPLETDTIDIRLQQFVPTEEFEESSSSGGEQKIPAYSSFGYASYVIPLDLILEYYVARFGAELLSDQCLLAKTATEEEVNDVLQAFWRDEQKLNPDNVVGLQLEPAETKVSPSIPEQNQATVLFENSPDSRSDIPLEHLRSRILTEISVQEGTYLPLYVKKMRSNLENKLIPEISNTIARKSWALIAEEPVGGLVTATRFLESLYARCKSALEKLQGIQQEVKDRTNKVAAKYAVARDWGNAALQNHPSWLRTLGRMGLLWAILIANLALVIAISLPAAWRYFVDFLLIPQGLYTLVLMGIGCALKYPVIDDTVGFYKIRKEEDNTPSPIALAVSIIYVLVIGGLLGWNFYHWSVDRAMPTPVLRYQRMILFGTFLIGLWAIINYIFWYWLDTRKMWYLASQWMDVHDELAKHNALLQRIAIGQEFYKAAEDVVNDQLQRIRAFREKLEQLQQDFQEKARQSLAALNSISLPFKKVAIASSKVENIYHEHILDIKYESTQFFRVPRPSFISWGEMDREAIKNSITQYIEERFSEYWQKHGVTQLSTPVEHPTGTELQKSFGWIAGEISKPYWPYYGGTQGVIRVYIGVGSQEQESDLLSALKSLAGSFGVAPLFFDTGDKHSVSCITFRYNVPLHLLALVGESKQQYEIYARKDETLHISAEMVSAMSDYDLFPKESQV